MKKIYKPLTVEFLQFSNQDAIMASVVFGSGDNSITDDFGEILLGGSEND